MKRPSISVRLTALEEKMRIMKEAVDYLMKSRTYIPKAEGEKARNATLMLNNKIAELKDILASYYL